MYISIQILRFCHRNKYILSFSLEVTRLCAFSFDSISTLHCASELLFCLSPVVFFSSSAYSRASAHNGECWATSKMSPPSTIFNAPPVIYKQISMSNQDHSLSPPCLMLKNTVWKPPFLYQLWIFIELHILINSPWVQAGNSADCVKVFRAEKTALSCYLSLVFSLGALKVSRLT